jgi:Holliday junction resolvasome RuvABC endonuclease subunit
MDVATTTVGAPTIGGGAPADRPRVYGLDISLTATGIASSLGWCDAIGEDGITTLPLRHRDSAIHELADRIITTISPYVDLVVIEAPAFSRRGGGAHERAGLWWRIVHYLHSRGVPVAEVLPNLRSIYATGKGQAAKTQVVEAVTRRWPAWQTAGDDNAADAVTLMALGMDHLGAALCPMPAKNRTALDKVAWPEPAGAA